MHVSHFPDPSISPSLTATSPQTSPLLLHPDQTPWHPLPHQYASVLSPNPMMTVSLHNPYGSSYMVHLPSPLGACLATSTSVSGPSPRTAAGPAPLPPGEENEMRPRTLASSSTAPPPLPPESAAAPPMSATQTPSHVDAYPERLCIQTQNAPLDTAPPPAAESCVLQRKHCFCHLPILSHRG